MKKAKRQFFDNKLDDLVKKKDVWQGVKWTKERSPPKFPRVVKSNGSAIETLQELWDAASAQFVGKQQDRKILWSVVNDLPQMETRSWFPFTILEIREALADTTNTSAPGPDHISWRLLKLICADEAFTRQLLTLFNQILEFSHWPTQFKESLTVIIPKPGRKDYTIMKNYRPIALLNCIGKLFTKVFANRLQYDAIAHNLLHPLQFGGLQQRSTTDAGCFLVNWAHQARQAGKITTCLAVDMAQYFPSMQCDVLAAVLTKQGFPSCCYQSHTAVL